MVLRAHQQLDRARVEALDFEVRLRTNDVKQEADQLMDFTEEAFRDQRQGLDEVHCALQWAQNSTTIFLGVKFASRWSAPGAIEIKDLTVNISERNFTLAAFGHHSSIRKRCLADQAEERWAEELRKASSPQKAAPKEAVAKAAADSSKKGQRVSISWQKRFQRHWKRLPKPVRKGAVQRVDREHVPESVLASSAYLDVLIEILNNKAGVREDDEKRRAFKAALMEQQRRRDETLAQFAVRRQRDFTHAASFGVAIPEAFRATMLREGAGLSEQNQQNLVALLQGHEDEVNAVAKALSKLDVRSDRIAAFSEVSPGVENFMSSNEENPDDDVLEFLGAEISLPNERVNFKKLGVSMEMKRLSSGHRTISLFSWEQGIEFPIPPELVSKYQLSSGDFNLVFPSAYMKESSSPLRTSSSVLSSSLAAEDCSIDPCFEPNHNFTCGHRLLDEDFTPDCSHAATAMTEQWGAPQEFLERLMLADENSPILGFSETGKPSTSGPFWAFRSALGEDDIDDGLREISFKAHEHDLRQCHRNLSWLTMRMKKMEDLDRLDFVELFSPSRVAPYVQRHGLQVDSNLIYDITAGWDARKKACRQSFRAMQRKRRPRVLMASPECKAFSQLRHINKCRADPQHLCRVLSEGLLMWNFSLEAVKTQIDQGSYFGLEHPAGAASWSLPSTQQLLRRPDVALITFDQCAFNLSVVPDGTKSRKATKVATNNPWLAYELFLAQCQGDHPHKTLIGGLPRRAQAYPSEFCEVIAISTKKAILSTAPPSFMGMREGDKDFAVTRRTPANHQVSFFGEDDEEDDNHDPALADEESPEQDGGELPKLTMAQRRLVQKVHVNTGHPDRVRMLRAFKAAGALPQVLRYIRDEFNCEDCSLKQGPDNRRRAQLPRTFAFNRVLCVDYLYVKFKGTQVPILNMVDAGTSFQIAVRAPEGGTRGGTPSSSSTWRLFVQTWMRYFGAPQMLICDAGNEFKANFERGLELCGILQHVILPECPWQNGRAERHGGWLKNRLDAELHGGRCNLETLEELDEFLASLTSVKNRWLCRGGYTPAQLVFGELPRIPGDLLAEDELGLHGLHDAHNDPSAIDEAAGEYRRRHEIRERARQLAMQQSSTEAIQRSRHAATHQQRHWSPGQWVYVFRRAKPTQDLHLRSRWVGPGVVVLANNDTVYVGMRSRLWRCSPEQIRAALPSEVLGRDLITNPGLGELLRQVVSGTHTGAVDVSKEGPPEPEDHLGPVRRDEAGVVARRRLTRDQACQMNLKLISVDEFNQLSSRRHAGDEDETEHQLWRGTYFNYQLGDEALSLDGQGNWTYLTKRNDEVSLKDMNEEDKKLFDASDDTEWNAILGTQAVHVIVGEQASAARRRWPDRILSSRMVRRRKPQPELHSWKAKSRWCVHGHRDPDTAEPQSEGLAMFLQVAVNEGMLCSFADVKNAFCQSRRLNRAAGPLFAEPCEGLKLPSGALISIDAPVYGLDDAPFEWRMTVTDFLVNDLQFERNLVEPCWFSRFEAGKLKAQIMVEVDDFIVAAGPEEHAKIKKALTTKFHFGKWEDREAEYAGRHIRTTAEAIYIDQGKYITEQIHPIPLARGRRSQADSPLTSEEFQALRSLIYKINWVARESRPEASGLASLMAGRLGHALVSDVAIVNKFVNFLRSTASRPLILWRYDPEEMCFIACSDAGGINVQGTDQLDEDGLPQDATQGAWMVLAAERLPEGKRPVRASPITWRSSKLKRKVFSTFGGETQAMLQGVNEAISSSNNPADWAPSKRSWCCAKKQLGCEGDSGAGFSCTGDATTWQQEQKTWCCVTAGMGCTTAPPAANELYDCTAGFANWQDAWPEEQQQWCCTNHGRACNTFEKAMAIDCDSAMANLAEDTKQWCCEHHGNDDSCFRTGVGMALLEALGIPRHGPLARWSAQLGAYLLSRGSRGQICLQGSLQGSVVLVPIYAPYRAWRWSPVPSMPEGFGRQAARLSLLALLAVWRAGGRVAPVTAELLEPPRNRQGQLLIPELRWDQRAIPSVLQQWQPAFILSFGALDSGPKTAINLSETRLPGEALGNPEIQERP
eukprot:g8070.t1